MAEPNKQTKLNSCCRSDNLEKVYFEHELDSVKTNFFKRILIYFANEIFSLNEEFLNWGGV